jgi:hypothetical protein
MMCYACIFCLVYVVGGDTNGTIDSLPDVAAGKTTIATVCVWQPTFTKLQLYQKLG